MGFFKNLISCGKPPKENDATWEATVRNEERPFPKVTVDPNSEREISYTKRYARASEYADLRSEYINSKRGYKSPAL